MRTAWAILVLLAVATLLCACGGGGGGAITSDAGTETGIVDKDTDHDAVPESSDSDADEGAETVEPNDGFGDTEEATELEIDQDTGQDVDSGGQTNVVPATGDSFVPTPLQRLSGATYTVIGGLVSSPVSSVLTGEKHMILGGATVVSATPEGGQ